METRVFGRTGATVSALGFGCGAVGGLMVRGSAADQERAVARAVEAGITFFDTAPMYGNGASETNLGRVLARLRPDIFLATKVLVRPEERADIAGAVARSVDASLRRLGRDHVDLLQLHNLIAADPADPAAGPTALPPDAVRDEVIGAMDRERDAGRVRFLGCTGLGVTADVLRVVTSGRLDAVQVAYNVLNPSAAGGTDAFVGQDFDGLLRRAEARRVGTIGIRALAGGALSGSVERHPVGMAEVAPLGSGPSYAADVALARELVPVLGPAGAADLVELAIRFALSDGGPAVVLVGTSTIEQLDHAIASAGKGPLAAPVLAEMARIRAAMAAG